VQGALETTAKRAPERLGYRDVPRNDKGFAMPPPGEQNTGSPMDQTREFANKLMGNPMVSKGMGTARQAVPSISDLQNWAARKFRPGS